MSSYQTDAVQSYRDLAATITTHLETSRDAPGTVSFLQGLRDTCLEHHVEYDKGLRGADDDEHVELLYETNILTLHEWSVRASDDLYWVRRQLERDLPGVSMLYDALLDDTRADNADAEDPDIYVATTNRIRTLLCRLDVLIQHSGVSLTPLFHVAGPTDADDFYFDTLETPRDGLPVQLAFDNQSPVGYVFII